MRQLATTVLALACVAAFGPGTPGEGATPGGAADAVQEPAAVVLRVEAVEPGTEEEAPPGEEGTEPAEEEAGGVDERAEYSEEEAEATHAGANVEVGAFLLPGAVVDPPPGGHVVLLLRDGEPVRIAESFEVPEAGAESDAGMDPLFRLLRALLDRPQDEAAGARGDADRAEESRVAPNDGVARPLQPAGGRRVRALTPHLAWRPVGGAELYRVRIWSSDEEILDMEAGADTAWRVPSDSPLSPGTAYEWDVAAFPAGNAGPSARFRVASRDVLDHVARELGRLRDLGLDPEEAGLLPAAALFRSMNLPYDAKAALDELRRRGDPWSEGLARFDRRLDAELAGAESPASDIRQEGGTP